MKLHWYHFWAMLWGSTDYRIIKKIKIIVGSTSSNVAVGGEIICKWKKTDKHGSTHRRTLNNCLVYSSFARYQLCFKFEFEICILTCKQIFFLQYFINSLAEEIKGDAVFTPTIFPLPKGKKEYNIVLFFSWLKVHMVIRTRQDIWQCWEN